MLETIQLPRPIRIMIADDKSEICESLEQTFITNLEKFGLSRSSIEIKKVFTEHAYEHGCKDFDKGFIPDICIFDLVFNGYTGVDLYKYIINKINNPKIWLCIYTGVEKKFDKRKEAEILSSQMEGLVTIIAKPNIDEIIKWYENILQSSYNISKIIDEKADPFDML